MKLFTPLLVIALIAVANFSQEPAPPQKQSVSPELDRELNQTVSFYRTGNFAEAQRHAERAVSLEPANLQAAIFLARVRHQRYRPGNATPDNIELARAAIAAYQNVLSLDAKNEEAYKAIAVLYASTHQDELLRAWIWQRAMNSQVANEKRAEAYAILAGKDWDCAFKFTELPNHKFAEPEGNQLVVKFRLPAEDVVEFQRIKQCVTNGLEMADAAILLEYENEAAWSYKTNLFLEAAKLAEMEGLGLAKADFERQAKEAGEQAARISEKRRRAEGSSDGGLEILPRPLPPPRVPKPLS